MKNAMKTVVALVTLAYAVVIVAGALTLPERVPSHWSSGSTPDAWGTRTQWVVTSSILGVVMALLLGGISVMTSRINLKGNWINLPNKQWWVATPEREARARDLMSSYMWGITAVVMAVLTIDQVMTMVAAHNAQGTLPGHGTVMWMLLIVCGIAVIWLTVSMIRHFRPETDS